MAHLYPLFDIATESLENSPLTSPTSSVRSAYTADLIRSILYCGNGAITRGQFLINESNYSHVVRRKLLVVPLIRLYRGQKGGLIAPPRRRARETTLLWNRKAGWLGGAHAPGPFLINQGCFVSRTRWSSTVVCTERKTFIDNMVCIQSQRYQV